MSDLGLLDTSVVIDLNILPPSALPLSLAISAITLAELTAGVHGAKDAHTRSVRLLRLQAVEASFEPLPLDANAARAYGSLVGQVLLAGQNPRPRRMDLLIAATAFANGLPLYTRNPKDFSALHRLLTVIPV